MTDKVTLTPTSVPVREIRKVLKKRDFFVLAFLANSETDDSGMKQGIIITVWQQGIRGVGDNSSFVDMYD